MRYITTRSNGERYEPLFVLNNDFPKDGGLFIPEEMPFYTSEDFARFLNKSFSDVVAETLNTLTDSQLSGWDIDFCVGRNVFRIASMNHRILITELWHNLSGDYQYFVDRLYTKITGNEGNTTDWFKISVKIAVLFGSYCELLKSEHLSLNQKFDISLPAGDFSAPMAAWYARKMGLPVQMIICACDEDSTIWDMIHRGNFNSSAAGVKLQKGIERLVQATLGNEEAVVYRRHCSAGQAYVVQEELLGSVNSAFFCAVTGAERAPSVINSVYQTNSYFIDPTTALCYGALRDYRARTGESRPTLVLALTNPLVYADLIKNATGVSDEVLALNLKKA